MERPDIDNPVIKEYVENIEKQLRNFSTESSFLKTYLALRKQADDLSEVYRSAKISADSMSDKDEKLFDRFIKYLDKVGILTDTLKKLEAEINPEVIKRANKYINNSGVSIEELLNK